MATETLAVNLIMNARQYKREAREAASATGQIGDSAKKTGTATGGLDKKMQGLAFTAKTALAIGAAAAVADFARDSIREAVDLQESINAVNRTFEDVAPAINQIGETAAQEFGLAQSEFNGFAVQFSNFAQSIAEGAGKSVPGVIQDLTGRIADFASVMNLDIPEAAEKFQSGLAGQVEPLRAFGIDVSAAAVSQKALELGLAETTSQLTEQDKVLARYELIMEQTDKTAGDFKATQDDLANAQRTFNAQLKDFQADIGQAALPVLSDLVGGLSDLVFVLDELVSMIPFVEDLGDVLSFVFERSALGFFLTQIGLVADALDEPIARTKTWQLELEAQHKSQLTAAASAGEVGDELEFVGGALARVQFEKAIGGFRDTGGFASDAADKLRDFRDAALALIDPTFAVFEAESELAEATEAYNDILDDNEATVEDVDQAVRDLAEAQATYNATVAAAPEDLAAAELAFKNLAEQAGIADEDIDRVAESIRSIESRQIFLDVFTRFQASGSAAARKAFEQNIGRFEVEQRALGGPVSPLTPYIVGEKGPEVFIPDRAGTIIPNVMTAQSTRAGGSGTVVNIGNVYGWDDFVRKVNEAGVTINRYGWTDG